jgi:hypothetical protein
MTIKQTNGLTRSTTRICGLVFMLQAGPSVLLAGQSETPELAGIWSGVYTAATDSRWRPADFACAVGCGQVFYHRLRTLLEDPRNDTLPFEQLERKAEIETRPLAMFLTAAGRQLHAQFDRREDPSIRCEPKGLGRQATNPFPMAITQNKERVVIRYEQWQAVRTIHLGSEAPPRVVPSLLGYSIGQYDGSTLVVETTGLRANILTTDGVPHSDRLRVLERYSLADGGDRLELELTLIDPVMLAAPVVITKSWLRTPEESILAESCDVVSGQP